MNQLARGCAHIAIQYDQALLIVLFSSRKVATSKTLSHNGATQERKRLNVLWTTEIQSNQGEMFIVAEKSTL